jgi:hypothetical protein
MVNELIRQSGNAASGFYLNEFEKLAALLKELDKQEQKVLLIGVTFGLLDFAERYPMDLQHTVIMETGGMKGRREELVRPRVQAILKEAFNATAIHSEYGMTELLSQAYSTGEGVFRTPPWMKVLLREEDDPLQISSSGAGALAKEPAVSSQQSAVGSRQQASGSSQSITGAINIIDLANIYSCSFIATDDAGRLFPDGSFEVIGRIDNSDLRGCSLMTM